ncbi:TetR/AcrR family transcriptional regulator [Nocardioides caeni]|uniref:TetR/AcrR family transcriptional regulator n=2 Tax=Nocardioides caeni TaxID=574700 RepID=A0A4S8NM50_9ACTN|nr:TetR/AcrR family transcriptional regulator [Nocardioides caeni]
MVDRIVASGRAVLVEHGYDAFSTNRVAHHAGISPGSLYQYFPDKEAVLDVVVDRYWDEIADRIAAALSDRVGGQPGPSMIRDTMDALLQALEYDRVLLQVVAEELPVGHSRERRTTLERRVRDLTTLFLATVPGTAGGVSPARTAWMLTVVAESVALRWVLDQPAGIEREQVIEEMVTLVGAYLLAPR